MTKNYDQSVKTDHNTNWSHISNHSYRIHIISDSGSDKTNVLLKLIKNQRPDIETFYLYLKIPFKSKYMNSLLMEEKSRKRNIIKFPKAFIINI